MEINRPGLKVNISYKLFFSKIEFKWKQTLNKTKLTSEAMFQKSGEIPSPWQISHTNKSY